MKLYSKEDETKSFLFDISDQRWNKINILRRSIQLSLSTSSSTSSSSSSIIPHQQWFLWLDSDLVILNSTILFQTCVDLIQAAILNDKHLIISKDSRPESGVINTGNI